MENRLVQQEENIKSINKSLNDLIDTQNVTFVHAQQEIENNKKVATKPADD